MTVKELRDKLSGFDEKARVVVYYDEGTEQQLFEIDDLSVRQGTPDRRDDKGVFKFDPRGSVAWLFIDVSEA